MKVLDAKVDWKKNWSNSPQLKLLVDEFPEDLVYEEKKLSNNHSLWFAEKEGLVRFYAENKIDTSGFGGRTFTLKTKEGEVKIRGPWSSRSGVMNKYFDVPCLEVTITDDSKVWERGHTFYAGAISLELAEKAMELIPDAELLKVYQFDDEVYYIPSKIIVCAHGELSANNRCIECGHKVYEPYKDGWKELKRG